ncbi:MAG: hypothetical protein QOI24_2207 [Acidobacteriota bacterium]|nr:hypothetical protein [Acidobacteriota bacterium]
MRRRFICIHGHFYQPPRENPWLEAVELQDSADPWHDWNERITAECYGPNASSRILDSRDRIEKIVNNYASINFNFGPTLLSWLQQSAPDTYAAIVEADRLSRERFGGHGSAISQAYNHMILPLANARDKRTQVRWGVRDFESRFGRKPAGMWLPETAVDVESLEALAAEGIVYTILEPHQAGRHRRIGEIEWNDTDGVDPTQPYLCTLPSGRTIAIFFYDGPISRAVAFEHLLARGENLAHRLLGAFSDAPTHPQLVNIATDGETYGHHHRFGDMALAYALDYIDERKLARISNYSQFLADILPEHEVEIVEDTAWSCSHGVGRWERDCGCSTGGGLGWNQQWRDPLRKSLDWLRDECITLFERHGAALLRDPWTARDEYIDVVLDRGDANVDAFLAKHATNGDGHVTALELLEMQRNAMLMYTSCGWFFNEISGIETVQVLHYAARVIQLAEKISGRSLELEFLERVAAARSNLREHGDARQIYEREVKPTRIDLRRVASHYAVLSLFDNFAPEAEVYCYRVRQADFETHRAGRARMAIGAITVISRITREEASYEFCVIHLGETELTGGVRPASSDFEAMKQVLTTELHDNGVTSVIRLVDDYFGDSLLSIRALFRDEQRRILRVICNATLEEAETAFRQLHERYDPLVRFHSSLGVPLPKVLHTAAEFDVNMQLRRYLDEDELPLAEIEQRLREARAERITLDETTLMTLTRALERISRAFAADPRNVERLEKLESLVSIVRAMEVDVDLRKPQNDYYRLRKTVRPVIASGQNGTTNANRWLQQFDSLGEKLSISLESRPA